MANKMYIVIRDTVPDQFVPVICAHSSLICFLKHKEDKRMEEWLDNSFRKCVVSAGVDEWNEVVQCKDYCIVHESALGDGIVALVFVPRDDFEPILRKLPLWKPQGQVQWKR